MLAMHCCRDEEALAAVGGPELGFLLLRDTPHAALQFACKALPAKRRAVCPSGAGTPALGLQPQPELPMGTQQGAAAADGSRVGAEAAQLPVAAQQGAAQQAAAAADDSRVGAEAAQLPVAAQQGAAQQGAAAADGSRVGAEAAQLPVAAQQGAAQQGAAISRGSCLLGSPLLGAEAQALSVALPQDAAAQVAARAEVSLWAVPPAWR